MADNDSMDIPSDRAALALEASWEIESIAKMVHDQLDDGGAENLVYRTLMRRCKKLNSLIMSALGDPNMADGELKAILEDGEVSHG